MEIGVEVGGLGGTLCAGSLPQSTQAASRIYLCHPLELLLWSIFAPSTWALGWAGAPPPPSVLPEASTLVSPASYGELNSRRREETPEGSHFRVPMPNLFPSVLHPQTHPCSPGAHSCCPVRGSGGAWHRGCLHECLCPLPTPAPCCLGCWFSPSAFFSASRVVGCRND